MEVADILTSMRFSPVLLAIFTASTALCPTLVRASSSPSAPVMLFENESNPGVGEVSSALMGVAPRELPPGGAIALAVPQVWPDEPMPLVRSLISQAPASGQPDAATTAPNEPAAAPVEVPSGENDAPAPIVPPSQGGTGPNSRPVPPQNQPGNPPPGTQTPAEETPNQIRLTPAPSPNLDIQRPDQPLFRPPAPVTPPGPGTPAETAEPEPRVLVAEVAVSGTEEQLQLIVYNAIRTQPGRTTTRSQLQEDSNRVFATGFFSSVRTVSEDTPLGVRVTFVVEPNPVLTGVRIQGGQVLPQSVVDGIFQPQFGSILNFRQFQQGVEQINRWYQDNGYVLAQVISAPQVSPEGVATLEVAEGVIEDIQVRFLNEDGQATDDEGNPVEGRTRDFIVLRQFSAQPGEVFNQNEIQSDLQRVFGLGIFEDARISLNPGQDPRQVDVTVNVTERNTGSLAAGLGISSASGLFGTVSFQEQNLGGNNQRLGAEVQLGQRDLLFDVSFTDPWIAGDPNRTSYTVNLFRRQSISLIFDGGEEEVRLPNDDRPRVVRLGGGVSFARPLSNGWRASVGLQYQNVTITDRGGERSPVDELGNDLSFSGSGRDDLILVQLGAVNDQRNSATAPTSGSLLRLTTDQSIPFGEGSILLTRLRGSYSYYIPVRITNFTEGPQALAFNVQVGTILGDLPPYEAFSLGGTDSVRGYDAGEVGSGRSFLQATAEYRFPIFNIVGGAIFADFGTDLGTGDNVPGEPAEIRDKPGTGFGVGAGLRVQSPVGVIRVDFAVNDEGENRIHFGIGERF